MSRASKWRSLATTLAYFNVALNLLGGSLLLAGIWLVAALGWTGWMVSARRRRQADAWRHSPFIMRAGTVQMLAPVTGELRRSMQPGERVIPIPQVGGVRKTQVPSRACGHWPRDEVRLTDGTTVAYICRRCDHDWANEDWVLTP